jgi:hypothetical protein
MYLSLLPRAPNRGEVETKIVELEKLVDQQHRTMSLPPDSVEQPSEGTHREPAPEPHDEATRPPSSLVETAPPPSSAEASSGRTLKISGLVVGGVGVAALATGIALSTLAKGYEGDVVKQFDPGKESDGKTFGVAGPVLIGVGAAAVATGAVLVVIGFKRRPAARAGRAQVSF